MHKDDDYKMEDEGSSDGWLNTYADLVTLLLCFFVLLYSMSTVDEQKLKQVINSFNTMGILSQQGDINSTQGTEQQNTDTDIDANIINQEAKKMDNLYSEVKDYISKNNLQDEVDVENQPNGVIIRFKNEILYDIGKAELKPDAKVKLTALSEILKKYSNEIKIEGHTDNIPIRNSKYENNWELSASRAISVVRFFSDEVSVDKKIPQERFQVAGYGQYRPIASNDTEQDRRKNRRIEIFIIKK